MLVCYKDIVAKKRDTKFDGFASYKKRFVIKCSEVGNLLRLANLCIYL